MTSASRVRRIAAVLALGLCVAGVASTFSDGGRVLHAHFTDAGQLVTGDAVAVAGRPIGTIEAIELTDDGLADVRMRIDSGSWPLHRGTTATIRAASQTGSANRYVAIVPGDVAAPALPDGAAIDLRTTRGIVDLDEVLNSFDAQARRDLKGYFRGAAASLEGVAPQANRALRYGVPALQQTDAWLAQVVADPPALRSLLNAGASVSGELARHARAIDSGIEHYATTLAAIDAERPALGEVLTRAPATLRHTTQTLARTRIALQRSVRPTLRALRPSAQPLATLLRSFPDAVERSVPLLRQLRTLLPYLTTAMRQAPGLAGITVPAQRAAAEALRASLPLLAGTREYAPDILSGLGSVGPGALASYDANGHWIRLGLRALVSSTKGPSATAANDLGPLLDTRLHQLARCPGGGAEAPPDKSAPVAEDPSLCDPADNVR